MVNPAGDAFGQLLREAGIEHHRLYDLRHTMTTLMLGRRARTQRLVRSGWDTPPSA